MGFILGAGAGVGVGLMGGIGGANLPERDA